MVIMMCWLFIAAVFISVKIVFRAITLPVRLLSRLLGNRGNSDRRYRDRYYFDAYDAPSWEYDEFDAWQDNQGF